MSEEFTSEEYRFVSQSWRALYHILSLLPTPRLFAEYTEEWGEGDRLDQWGRPLIHLGGDRWLTRDQYEENGR